MSIYYADYIWKEGIPYGIKASSNEKITYKIPMDPYRKFISIERYEEGQFTQTIYDSRLLDFRHLKIENQLAWEKTAINEMRNEIRNQDDRLLFFEDFTFVDSLCKECRVSSPQGILLSLHRMFYTSYGDSFNGVALFDANNKPVMVKLYEIDEETGEFSKLIKELWENRPLV